MDELQVYWVEGGSWLASLLGQSGNGLAHVRMFPASLGRSVGSLAAVAILTYVTNVLLLVWAEDLCAATRPDFCSLRRTGSNSYNLDRVRKV
jgi:hypothetical protein